MIAYNDRNTGTEGANPGNHPAFPSGQDNLREVAATRGARDDIYHHALNHIHRRTRDEGIDAALRLRKGSNETTQFDALLLCDRKGAGQQLAAQAGYPIICIPIGLDDKGLPVSLSLQQTAWAEGTLIKWASAIEDLLKGLNGKGRAQPTFKNYTSKNLPIDTV